MNTSFSISKSYYIFLIAFLGLLSAFGPFVIDMYLPALPEMIEVFHCNTSMVQLGLTFCMVGLAAGQILFGPVSDKFGRKPVLIFSLIVFVCSSIICCFSTSIAVFTCARLLQGIGGAGGIVLSRSIAADMYSGQELAKLIAILSAINNLAPIAAPVVGGGVTHAWGWQGIFIILLILGCILLLLSLPLQESLASHRRFKGNLISSVKGYHVVFHIKGFIAYSIVYALGMAALFAYISSTPFIIQSIYGFTELQFSLVFAVNAIGLAAGSYLSIKFKSMKTAALFGSVTGGIFALIGIFTNLFAKSSFFLYEIPVFLMLFGIGLVLTGATVQAMNLGRECAGAASAVIGGIGYITGGLVSPLVAPNNIIITSFILCAAFLIVGNIIILEQKKH